MKNLKFTYLFCVCCELFLVFLCLIFVCFAAFNIIPNTEHKALAYFLTGFLGLGGVVAIFWSWSGTMKVLRKALREQIKAANVLSRISFLKKEIEKSKLKLAEYGDLFLPDEDNSTPDSNVGKEMDKLNALQKELQDLEFSGKSKE